jgi:hypothetical protein
LKAKHLALGVLVIAATGGLWLALPFRYATMSQEDTMEVNSKGQQSAVPGQNSPADLSPVPHPSRTRHVPEPPVPNRRFMDFSPEQRVQFARQGHGPGG